MNKTKQNTMQNSKQKPFQKIFTTTTATITTAAASTTATTTATKKRNGLRHCFTPYRLNGLVFFHPHNSIIISDRYSASNNYRKKCKGNLKQEASPNVIYCGNPSK